MIYRNRMYQAPEGDAPAGGAAPAASGTPAPGDAAAVVAAAAAAAAPESLLKAPPAGDTPKPDAVAVGAPEWASKVPEKFLVKAADGSLDMQATLVKQAESYTNLERARGPQTPATPADYTFEAPERFKDRGPDEVVSGAFRERMHKLKLTQEQFAGVMGEYFDILPAVLDTALQTTVAEARAELSKVWTTPAAFEAGVSDAQRAVDGAPVAIRQKVWEKFGRDPDFLQFAASMGHEMREDRAPANPAGGQQGASEIQAVMQSKAYRDPAHPEHAQVSARVRAHMERISGTAPIAA